MAKNNSNSIIIDSNVLIALFNSEDSLHKKAKKLLIKYQEYQKIVNYFVYSEMVTVLLLRTKNNDLNKNLSSHLLNDGVEDFKIIPISERIFAKTQEVFLLQKSHKLSFTDRSLISQAEILGIKKILTFDKDLIKNSSHKFEFLD